MNNGMARATRCSLSTSAKTIVTEQPDLRIAARRIIENNGFEPDFAADVTRQVAAIRAPALPTPDVRDLRSLPWSSFDNVESRDLDQVEVAELLDDHAS